MRLHRLEVAAFGPFPGQESVDFDVLGGDGLFLLHGETGAGKTTLLDAIAFALFGAVPGARGQVKRLRCDLAAAETATQVALELTVQGQRLRIVRHPEYERPKKRGTGTTTQQAKASLSWIDAVPHGQPPEGITRVDEVSRTVQRLLGMNAEQFFQVVLLPQGEFARFLRAETNEREQLLERLFGTRRFADVERWFRDSRTANGRALEQGRQGVRDWTSRVAQAARTDLPEDGEVGAWAGKLLQEAVEQAAHAAAAERLARTEQERADGALQERRTRAERVRRVRSARARLRALGEQQEQRVGWSNEVAAARRVAAVMDAAGEADRLTDRLERAEDMETRRAKVVAELRPEDADLPVPALRANAGALREQAGALAGLVREAHQQERDTLRLAEATGVAERVRREIEEIDAALSALPERLRVLHADRDLATQAESTVEGVREREGELAEAASSAGRIPALTTAVGRAWDAERDAADVHLRMRSQLDEVRNRRLVGMAAELATDLRDGQPCSVCGSVEHPAPARPGDEAADEQAEQAAAESEQAADARWRRAVEKRHAATAELVAAQEKLGGRTPEEIDARLVAIRGELASLERAAERRAELETLLATVQAESEQLAARKADRERSAAAAEAEAAALAEQIAQRERRLDEARGEHPDVGARRAHLHRLVEALEQLAEARASRSQAQERLIEQRAVVEESLRRAKFDTVDLARAAVRTDEAIEDLSARIAEADAAEAAAHATLAEPELRELDGEESVDVDAALADAEQARVAAEGAVAGARAAEQRAADLGRLTEGLTNALSELAPAEAEFAELDALTDVLNGRGQNARRMSLRSYVLAARLEEVAVSATARLQTMSQGRYSFVHSDAAGSRGTRGGLGLDVLDDYSGAVRPSKTLSGGESFLASLALALGLADVVAADTGGALLDTLFVDEGFGTLDAETLDVVMDVLDELRAGGRVVGLVSHVEELRQRIPTRLRVRKSRGGSALELQR